MRGDVMGCDVMCAAEWRVALLCNGRLFSIAAACVGLLVCAGPDEA